MEGTRTYTSHLRMPSFYETEKFSGHHYKKDSQPYYAYTNFVTFGPNFPDWKERIKQGRNATTFMEGEKWSTEYQAGWFHYRADADSYPSAAFKYADAYGFPYGGVVPAPHPVDASKVYAADQAALVAVGRDIIQKQMQFNAPVFLGEWRETVRMLRHPIQGIKRKCIDHNERLKKAYRGSLRNSKGSKIGTIRDDVQTERFSLSNFWLNLQFGVTPFLNDIQDIMSYIASRRDDIPDRVKVSGIGKVNAGSVSGPNGAMTGVYANQYSHSVNYVDQAYARYYGQIGMIPEGTIASNLQQLGVGWRNFVPTLYELTPYSWLIDYFTSLGDIVNALSINRASVLWLSRVHAWKSTGTVVPYKLPDEYRELNGGTLRLMESKPMRLKIAFNHFERAQYNVSLVPDFRFNLGLSLKQEANVFAVLRNQAEDTIKRLLK